MIFKEHLEELKKSDWPRCIEVAQMIAKIPGSAETLEAAATKARTHHVRSAALKALAEVDKTRAINVAEKLRNDVSYEVRMDAAEVLESVTSEK